jgi:site-specific DNA recombinase
MSNTPKIDALENQRPTRCALYTRVSTDQQAEVEFNSCEAQEDRIRSFIASQQSFELAKVYSDPGYTGANTDRPGLQRLLADIRSGLIDMVITYKIDRLTRSPRDFYQLIEQFEAHNVGFISVTERFDTSTPSGRLLRNIMLTFAQFERELASERIRDKFMQRAQRGLYNGGHPPLGYKRENGKLVVDRRKAAITRFIFESYIQTHSPKAVLSALVEKGLLAKTGRIYGLSFVYHTLRNRVLIGKVVHRGQVYPGQHPAIISEDLFNRVQEMLIVEPRRAPRPYENLPYAGLINCEECGSVMSPTHTDKRNVDGPRRYFYYRCTKTNHHGWGSCGTRQIGAERFHDLIYKNLLRISLDAEHLKNLVYSLKNKTRHPGVEGIEPQEEFRDLTHEKVQNSLKTFLKECARKTGMEKTFAVRRRIRGIRYSRGTVTVDFGWENPPDGKTGTEWESSAPALRAGGGDSSGFAPKTKRPDSFGKSGPFGQFVSEKMSG